MNIKKQLAQTFNVTENYVGKVLAGKRHNKAITDAYGIYQAEAAKAAKKIAKLSRVNSKSETEKAA